MGFCVLFAVFVLYISCSLSEASRFRHPLTVTDMRSFASPFNGGYGSYVGAAGTPERYDLVNRIAGRTRPEADAVAPEVEDKPLAAELRTLPETGNEQPEEYISVYRRNANDPYARRLRRREKELNKLYEKMNQWNEGKKKKKKCQNVTRQNSIGVFFMLAKNFEMAIFYIV